MTSNDKLSLSDASYLKNFEASVYKTEYSKKFVIVADSLFCAFKERNRPVVGVSVYPNISSVHDVNVVYRAEICDYVTKVLKYDSRDAIHVLSFGFEAISLNPTENVGKIASSILSALKAATKMIKGRRIKHWFLTIPEIGDFAAKFREFNNFFRKAVKKSGNLNLALFDFSKLVMTRPKTNELERFRMLLKFFEQKKGLQLLPVLPDPENFVIRPEASSSSVIDV